MIELSPNYDSAIAVHSNGLSIRFAEIPDLEIAQAIYSLVDQHKGITMPDDWQDGDLSSDGSDRQRLYYWLQISLVFEVEAVAYSIGVYLKKHHKLSVRIVVKPEYDEPDKVTVLRPAEEI